MKINSFERTMYNTDDGYYSIWTLYKPNTKPIVIFPDLDHGAILYCNISKTFDRTIYIIEVSNINYTTPLSNSQCSSKNLYNIISKHILNNNHSDNYDIFPDIFAHSIGSIHAAMFINELYTKNDITKITNKLSKQNIVICDGTSCIYDIIISNIHPFIQFIDYKKIKKVNNIYEFYSFIKFIHTLEFNAWSKRFYNLYDGSFWRDYFHSNLKFIYSKNDILIDSEYIISKMTSNDYIFYDKGKYESYLFGKNSKINIQEISDILNTRQYFISLKYSSNNKYNIILY
jgi:hypothetical protein